jgi:hypothetical protein
MDVKGDLIQIEKKQKNKKKKQKKKQKNKKIKTTCSKIKFHKDSQQNKPPIVLYRYKYQSINITYPNSAIMFLN